MVRKGTILFLPVLILCSLVSGCNRKENKINENNEVSMESDSLTLGGEWNVEDRVKPLWSTKRVEEESVMLVSVDGAMPCGNLIFKPTKIISVYTYDMIMGIKREWKEGEDFVIDDNQITALSEDIPSMTSKQVLGEERIPGFNYSDIPSVTAGLYLPFTEGTEIISKQIYVTYEHEDEFLGHVPTYALEKLPRTKEKLRNKGELQLFVYGDSISTGANSTGYLNVYPYKDSWPDMVAKNLSRHYDTEVVLLNKAVGGWTSENAIKSTESTGWVKGKEIKQSGIKGTLGEMPDYYPDLVILGFGMNDATLGVGKQEYKLYMNKIIKTIRERNKDCEFILLGSMLANPMAINQSKNQISYFKILEEIVEENEGIVAVNIGQIHQDLLDAGKGYLDMTSNNVNHPNDFFASCYAMSILSLLISH
ncbi:SGNH/GDSL hydrolase family protein [Lachnoclostridium phytofermentans]|uniref:SGNH hydrolase-type esterase domain-containing protein n=1 Tax=Lachnoclostridium phytofermentans (strain ATCC 700394 / DSM 18823 / ISDg) TaxID=357809 RepID=A9KM57_LACP7|nr:SGNH/GDSL hydrolase family protein [Lachnoclostridium phytofermentans]ABX41400.1 hypothetical protein Cphy_1020 [Lachnoclostridium phytofermentans ISDg]